MSVYDGAEKLDRSIRRRCVSPTGDGSSRRDRHPKILVAEDELGIRQLVRRILEMDGYTVLLAEEGEEALRIVDEEGPIDLLITDALMPKMTGKELVSRLSATHPQLRCLFISGFPEEDIAASDESAARMDYLPKPFDAEALLIKVRRMLAEH